MRRLGDAGERGAQNRSDGTSCIRREVELLKVRPDPVNASIVASRSSIFQTAGTRGTRHTRY